MGARAKRQPPKRRVAAADVSIELRGAGNCSPQVHNFGTAEVFEAGSLIACEVITPGGNWSSYPAHEHDEESPVESQLEEIYYFEIDDGPNQSGKACRVSATTSSTAPRIARSRFSTRSAPAMSCWCRTATTARRSPRRAATCTTST